MILWPATVCLSQNDDRYNYRDLCRSIIAGSYWQTTDDLNTSELFIKLNKSNTAKLEAELVKTKERMKALVASKAKKTFDPARDNQLRVTEGRISFLEKTIEKNKRKLPDLEKKYKRLKTTREEMKLRMDKVFNIVEKPADTTGTVPKSILYKTKCPKYRHVCPLPPDERKALLEIFNRQTVPTPCLKYSYIR
jgi:hypothetical protein